MGSSNGHDNRARTVGVSDNGHLVAVDVTQNVWIESNIRGAIDRHDAPAQDDDPIRMCSRESEVVDHHDNRGPVLGALAQQVERPLLMMDVKRCGGFIQEEDPGLLGEGPREGHPRALSPG